jgi:hypothetical protein
MPHMKEELLSFTRQLDRNRAELTREFDELRKDKERLDWMLREYNICRFGYQRLTRDDIDEAMKGESL